MGSLLVGSLNMSSIIVDTLLISSLSVGPLLFELINSGHTNIKVNIRVAPIERGVWGLIEGEGWSPRYIFTRRAFSPSCHIVLLTFHKRGCHPFMDGHNMISSIKRGAPLLLDLILFWPSIGGVAHPFYGSSNNIGFNKRGSPLILQLKLILASIKGSTPLFVLLFSCFRKLGRIHCFTRFQSSFTLVLTLFNFRFLGSGAVLTGLLWLKVRPLRVHGSDFRPVERSSTFPVAIPTKKDTFMSEANKRVLFWGNGGGNQTTHKQNTSEGGNEPRRGSLPP